MSKKTFKAWSLGYLIYFVFTLSAMWLTSNDYTAYGFKGYTLADYLIASIRLIIIYGLSIVAIGIYNNIVYRLRGGRYGR